MSDRKVYTAPVLESLGLNETRDITITIGLGIPGLGS